MANSQTLEPTQQKPLRLWPGIVAVVLQWLAFYVVPIVLPGPSAGYIAPLGAVLGGLAVIVWWAFFSRAPRSDRWGAIVLMIVAMLATSRVIHESIGEGMFGMMFVLFALPLLSLAFVGWAAASRRLADRPRRAAMVCNHPARLRRMDAGPVQWHHRHRHSGLRMALVGNFRGTALGRNRRRAGGALIGCDISGDRSRLAWLSGARPRRHHFGSAHRNRLVRVAAGRAVASADRARLVVLCGPWRPPLHPGAAR